MPKVFELKKRRQALVDKARAEHERISTPEEGGEFRALTTEDKATVDGLLEEVTTLDELIDRLEALESVQPDGEMESEDYEGEERTVRNSRSRRKTLPGNLGSRNEGGIEFNALSPMGQARRYYSSPEYRKAFNHYVYTGQFVAPAEYRDMTLGTGSLGGYLVTPTQISDNIVMAMNNLTFIRQLATIETVTTAQSLGVRQITTQPSDAAWTSEIGSITGDTSMVFGRRDMTPNLLTKMINISIRLAEASPDSEPLIKDRLAYKFAVAEENGFLNGTGSGQALGVFTASASGIPTAQDYVVTAASSTVFSPDLMVSARYQIKQQYLGDKTARWIFHRAFINGLRLLKDSNGRYLWYDGNGFASVANAAPTSFDGIPVHISEYAPSAVTAGSYCGILGAFRYYEIAQVRDMQIQRLVELLAGTSEIGFLGRRWVDGSPVLGEAFLRLQIHP